MSARVLVVDDLPANVKVLEAKLSAEYFTVITAMSGAEALERAVRESPDIILLDVMMPEMDGFQVCQHLKANPVTAHIPVVMVTALSDVSDRVTGLESGADDFLTKPVNDLTLFARIRSLVRMKRAMDEWRMREETCDRFGLMPSVRATDSEEKLVGRVLIVEPDELVGERLRNALEGEGHDVTSLRRAEEALSLLVKERFDLVLTSLYLDDGDGLRFCSQLRAIEECRTVPVLLVVEAEEIGGLVKGFELGVDDYLIRPVDINELKARTRTQLRQKRYRERLQESYQRSLSLALTDDLTGLYNSRYLTAHLQTAIATSRAKRKPLSLLMIDIDFFKSVNDSYGHAVGDKVLSAMARRLVYHLREFDMAARVGGEEFVVVMPESEPDIALRVAERLRKIIGDTPFDVDVTDGPLQITISVGIAYTRSAADTPETLLARADEALYMAKRGGRNRVVAPPELGDTRRILIGS
jgi:two-component system cell cycle response regulator